MYELKSFALRFLVAAFLVAICMTISRGAESQSNANAITLEHQALATAIR